VSEQIRYACRSNASERFRDPPVLLMAEKPTPGTTSWREWCGEVICTMKYSVWIATFAVEIRPGKCVEVDLSGKRVET
jgi:hypothetical protein